MHQDVVTCVALNECVRRMLLQLGVHNLTRNPPRLCLGRHALVTGSLDATLRVWHFVGGTVTTPCEHVLHSHDDAITCVDVSIAHDLVVSGR